MRPIALREQLRSLLSPDPGRWKPMLMGLAGFAAGVGTVVKLQPPAFVAAALVMVSMASWIVGAYAMIGYVRWFYATETKRMADEKPDGKDRQNKQDR